MSKAIPTTRVSLYVREAVDLSDWMVALLSFVKKQTPLCDIAIKEEAQGIEHKRQSSSNACGLTG
jgi:hypothetical protein